LIQLKDPNGLFSDYYFTLVVEPPINTAPPVFSPALPIETIFVALGEEKLIELP
jgi:hypothetical protein